MKKKLLLLVMLILLSGCDVNYQLNFTDNQLIEDVHFTLPNSEEKKINYLEKVSAYAIFDGIGRYPYNTNFSKGIKNYNANFNYTYKLEDFGRAYYINQCFDAVNFAQHDNQYVLLTSTGFKCMLFDYYKIDNLTVTITTNHTVIENNADSKKRNSYTWNITEQNAENVKISMVFGQVKQRTFLDIIMENILAISIIAGFVFAIGIVILVIIMKAKKNNEI